MMRTGDRFSVARDEAVINLREMAGQHLDDRTPTAVATRPLLLLRDERLGHAIHQDGVCFALDELGS